MVLKLSHNQIYCKFFTLQCLLGLATARKQRQEVLKVKTAFVVIHVKSYEFWGSWGELVFCCSCLLGFVAFLFGWFAFSFYY